MATNTNLTDKEKGFLSTMVNVEGVEYQGRKEFAEKYKEKYGCDPCDACGPDACADCNACLLENSVGDETINPFEGIKRRINSD